MKSLREGEEGGGEISRGVVWSQLGSSRESFVLKVIALEQPVAIDW